MRCAGAMSRGCLSGSVAHCKTRFTLRCTHEGIILAGEYSRCIYILCLYVEIIGALALPLTHQLHKYMKFSFATSRTTLPLHFLFFLPRCNYKTGLSTVISP